MGKMKDLTIDQANAFAELEKQIDIVSNLTTTLKGIDPSIRCREWGKAERNFRRAFLEAYDIANIFPWFRGFDVEDFIACGDIDVYKECGDNTIFEVRLYVGYTYIQVCVGDYSIDIFRSSLKDFRKNHDEFIKSGEKVRKYINNIVHELHNVSIEIRSLIR